MTTSIDIPILRKGHIAPAKHAGLPRAHGQKPDAFADLVADKDTLQRRALPETADLRPDQIRFVQKRRDILASPCRGEGKVGVGSSDCGRETDPHPSLPLSGGGADSRDLSAISIYPRSPDADRETTKDAASEPLIGDQVPAQAIFTMPQGEKPQIGLPVVPRERPSASDEPVVMSSLASPAIQHPLDQEDRPVPRPISVIPAEAGTHRTTGTKREFVPSGTMAPGLSPSRSQSFASAEQGRRDDGWEEDLPETETRAVQGATVRSADIRVSDKSLNIEIVDLRTFHAPASDGQASAGVRAVIDLVLSGPERAAPTAFNPNLDAPRSEVRHLKIKLQPEHLGELTASLKLRGDELRVDIETHTGVALETIRHDEGILREALRNAGFDTATLTIVLSPASKDTVQAAATTDFAGQPQSFGERPEGDGRSQAEREKQRGFATRENSWSETDDQADPDASAPRRADGIFL